MNVSTEHKTQMLSVIINSVMGGLASGAEDGEATADDVVDLFVMGIAAVLDNDTNLKTPRDLRLGADTVAKLVEKRAKEFRSMQAEAGVSWLSVVMERRDGVPN